MIKNTTNKLSTLQEHPILNCRIIVHSTKMSLWHWSIKQNTESKRKKGKYSMKSTDEMKPNQN